MDRKVAIQWGSHDEGSRGSSYWIERLPKGKSAEFKERKKRGNWSRWIAGERQLLTKLMKGVGALTSRLFKGGGNKRDEGNGAWEGTQKGGVRRKKTYGIRMEGIKHR